MNLTTLDGRFVDSNPVFRRMLGYTQDELLALSFQDVTHPDDLDAVTLLFAEVIAGKREWYQIEKRYLKKDGTPLWVRVAVSPLLVPTGGLLPGRPGDPIYILGMIEDISDRKRTEAALAESEQRYRSLVETSLDGIAIVDLNGTVTFANRQCATLLGRTTAAELVGVMSLDLVAPEDRPLAAAELQRVQEVGSVLNVQVRIQRADGTVFPAEVSGSLLRDQAGQPVGITSVIRDVTERQAYETQLRHQALHDALTELPNRTLFNDRLEQALRQARREGVPFAVLIADLDRFKDVNDTLGHHTGDVLLCKISERFQRAFRESDTVARLGGDEFGALLPGADEAGAVRAASKLLESLAEPVQLEGQVFYLNLSAGIAVFPEHGDEAPALLRCADIAMYAAKRSGKGYAVYASEADPHSERRLTLMAGLREAVEAGQLALYYQPKIDLITGSARSAEALLRWIHPDLGPIPPEQFIPLAEQTGLIKPMTAWVIGEALLQVRRWRNRGIEVTVAVNLSTWNLQERDLVEAVSASLDQCGLPGSALTVEITESALMVDPQHALFALSSLHALGIRVSIDDFGTGYSSLAYLQRLPVDEIKVDRSFVRDMSDPNSGSSIIVRSVVDLGHNLGLVVTAEGIESREHLDILRAMGCDCAQGYYLARPLPADRFESWLAAWERKPLLMRKSSPVR